MRRPTRLAVFVFCAAIGSRLAAQTALPPARPPLAKGGGDWAQLSAEAARIGKPAWRPMLAYVARLHQRATHPAAWPFDYEWEDLGPGYDNPLLAMARLYDAVK